MFVAGYFQYQAYYFTSNSISVVCPGSAKASLLMELIL